MVPKLKETFEKWKRSCPAVPVERSLMEFIDMNPWKIDEKALTEFLN
jgi:hypothetical protein